MSLFQLGDFKAASGKILPWKIECDALTDADWKCLAFMIADKIPAHSFHSVFGVPTGGEKLAKALQKYADPQGKRRLLVDDVYTTGGTISKYWQTGDLTWVVFARKLPPPHIDYLFLMRG